MTSPTSKRVLISAYQCAPGQGSVSQIGWEWYSRMAKKTPTTLVTHVRNRPHIEAALAAPEQHDIIYIDTEWFAGPLYRTASKLFRTSQHAVFLVSSLDFFLYDRLAYKTLAKRQRQGNGNWDVVHAATPVSTAAPTCLHRLGLPVVLGPLNSGLQTPPQFADILAEDSTWLYPLRKLGRLADRLIGSSAHAVAILTATQATRQSLTHKQRQLSIEMIENGIDLQRFQATPWPQSPDKRNALRVLFVGRLVPFKGISLLLQAVNQVRAELRVDVRIVGDGPMQKTWQDESERLGLKHNVHFVGAQTLDEVAQHMRWAHLFCLPSVRESGGGVLLEAMASGRPVTAIAYGGPAEIVDDEVGSLLPDTNSKDVVTALTQLLHEVYNNPQVWEQKGIAARRRAADLYDWDAKIDQALTLYGNVA